MSGHFNNASYAGMHVIVDFWGSNEQILKDSDAIRSCLIRAARAAGATVLADNFHYFGEESGVTGVVVLSESHISIHTWPEENYAAVDIFMCGACDPRVSVDIIAEALESSNYDSNILFRGIRKIAPLQIARSESAPIKFSERQNLKKSVTA